MKLLKLGLENWGPYDGRHAIDLDVSPSAPVVLIRGENMRGKTSLLRAIVWCLYGRIRLQDGRTPLSVAEMVNRDALLEDSAEYSVAVDFSHDGKKLSLIRSGSAHVDAVGEIQLRNARVTLHIEGVGAAPEQAIPGIIEDILSEQVSDFYLFDGEMLNRFEERLREDRESSRRFVREQIERALGLPFLTRLRDDLSEIESGLAEQLKRASRGDKKGQDLREDLEKAEQAIEILEHDVVELSAESETLRSRIDDIDRQLEAADEVRESFYKRKALENQLESSLRKLENFRDQLSGYADQHWWFPLASRLQLRHEELTGLLGQANEVDQRRNRLNWEIERLASQEAEQVCDSCGQVLPHSHAEALRQKEADLRRQLSSLADSVDVSEVQRGLILLQDYAAGTAVQERVDDLDKDVRRLQIEIDKLRSDIRGLDELLAGNSVEFSVLEAQRREARDLLHVASSSTEKKEQQVADLKAHRSRLRSQISKLPEVDPLDGTRMKVYSEAVETVSGSFDLFRDAMRGEIEGLASGIFRRLTTEKDYTGVMLRPDYSMAVLDPEGRPVNMISAGANQVLTMSFIGALARSSRDEAPMIMDTPLGRLDKGHRASILEWVGSMDNQVILFVQSGEYDPQADAARLSGKIGREYIIERLGPTSSRVVSTA